MNKNCDTELAVARLTEVPLRDLVSGYGFFDGTGYGYACGYDFGNGEGYVDGSGYGSGYGYGGSTPHTTHEQKLRHRTRHCQDR